MAYEQKNFLSARSSFVKSALALGALCLPVYAAPAQADEVVTFRFNLSELNGENGVTDVYARMENLANSECQKGKLSSSQSAAVKWCADDLLDQLIESADVPELTVLHMSKSAPKSNFLAGLFK